MNKLNANSQVDRSDFGGDCAARSQRRGIGKRGSGLKRKSRNFSPIGKKLPFYFNVSLYFSIFNSWICDCIRLRRIGLEGESMLKIRRSGNGEVMFTVVGRMDSEHAAEMKRLFESEEGRRIVLDLKDLTLVDRDAVKFLEQCEADSIELKNCPAYIREWIRRERASPEES